jgi:hypothetical protein
MKISQGLSLLVAALVSLAGLLPLAGAEESSTPIVPSKRIDLFDGKDFKGLVLFSSEPSTNTWTIENRVIHCSGKPNGYLRSEGSYRDYKLTVEWRFVKIAPKADNSGVLVHMQLPDKLWPPCVQAQGKHDAQGDLLFMAGAESKEHLGMDAATAVPKRGPSNEKPVGEWNKCEVICSSTSVTVYINDKLMNVATDCTVNSGRIGMQCEGAELEIRKMFVEPLPKSLKVQ